MMDEVLRSPYATDTDKKYSDLAGMNLSITSRIKDFDLNGNPTDIYLTLDNATMDNWSPRLSSSTGLSDAEIMSILGQNILPSTTYSSTGLSSLAYISSVALDVFSQVGGINASSKTPSKTQPKGHWDLICSLFVSEFSIISWQTSYRIPHIAITLHWRFPDILTELRFLWENTLQTAYFSMLPFTFYHQKKR